MSSNDTVDGAKLPEILAPAGDRESFLAAVAAGADAVYCGLKSFSARAEAKNFSLAELAGLTRLAHAHRVRVYVAFNSLLRPGEIERVGGLLTALHRNVKPDALITQDLAVISMAKKIGFKGEIHLSTLSNVTFPAGLSSVRKDFGFDRVVMPRELNIDEVKSMAAACPAGLGLEVFIHGALCYGVSGRCYWSSFLGGKSGLRGRCVQPCRRRYEQKGSRSRLFSCKDLSLDVLVRVLRSIPQIRAWKIEGRKKGPHYVYHTVTAYRMLRDHGDDPKQKRAALEVLAMALGRAGTHYLFLPQRPQQAVDTKVDTGSGLMLGRVKSPAKNPYLNPSIDLFADDLLRIGYEDQAFHAVVKVKRFVPKGGRFHIAVKSRRPLDKGAPVFLIDRRGDEVTTAIRALEKELIVPSPVSEGTFRLRHVRGKRKKDKAGVRRMHVFRHLSEADASTRGLNPAESGFWLMDRTSEDGAPQTAENWCWMPPVIWPQNEAALKERLRYHIAAGARRFVVNAPWQMRLFGDGGPFDIWAGPFCNVTNSAVIEAMARVGCAGVIVAPELPGSDLLDLPKASVLPLGIVTKGLWPLCISRIVSEDLLPDVLFYSPKKEGAWVSIRNDNHWVFPNWQLDLTSEKRRLADAGYSVFVELHEPVPETISLKKRPGRWNWDADLP